MGKSNGRSSYVKMQQSNQRSSNYRVQNGGKQQKQSKNEQNGKKERGVGLLKYLTFKPEYREDGGQTAALPEGVGRFRHFWQVGQRRNGSIMIANLMFVLFALPLLAIFAVMHALGGPEAIAYSVLGMDPPYLMTNIGFGISEFAFSVFDIQQYIQNVYYVVFAAAGVGAFIMSLGLLGMMPLCMKFIIGDTFVSKKDNYGNDVPKAITEFFRGVKKYWWQYLIVGAFLAVLVAGVGDAFVLFVGNFQMGIANAGHWILMFFAGIVGLFGLMFTMHLMPIIVLYDMPFTEKMKNAAIFTVQMFLQNIFIIAAFSVPFLLIGLTNTIVSSIVVAVVLVFGSKYYCLTMCNYEQYLSEKIITPIYNSAYTKAEKKKKKK